MRTNNPSTAEVYILGAPKGPIKIGFTARGAKKRLSHAEKTGPLPVCALLWSQEHCEARLVEMLAHLYLEKYAIGREWFAVPLIQAKRAIAASIKVLGTRPVWKRPPPKQTFFQKVGISDEVLAQFLRRRPKLPYNTAALKLGRRPLEIANYLAMKKRKDKRDAKN